MSQRLDHNRNGKQHDSCRNNQKDRGLCSTPHALNVALTVGESASRLHKFRTHSPDSPVARCCRACASLRAEGARGFPWIVELIGLAKAADAAHVCPALFDGEESAI